MEIMNADEKRMWREYCAIVQLPMRVFLDIQNTLLSEQLEVISQSDWHSSFAGGHPPKSIEEFRRTVPLHRWQDYAGLLQPESPNGFANDLHCWVQTSWCHGSWKQVPWTRRFFDTQCRHVIAALMMSVARYEGDVRLNKSFRVLPALPESPFASAWLLMGVKERDVVSARFAPPEDTVSMSDLLQAQVQRSLDFGVDCVIGMASTLLMARREFQKVVARTTFRQLLLGGRYHAAARWGLGKLRSLVNARPWEPKSLVSPKSIIAWGADTSFLTPKLEAQWGAPHSLSFTPPVKAALLRCMTGGARGWCPCPPACF